MKRNKLKIGQQVKVVPVHTYNEDGSIKSYRSMIMWVRELHDKNCAGLSYRKNGKSIYGVLYGIIHPIK